MVGGSAPFFTVDTTPPEAVRQLQAFPGDRSAGLVWLSPNDSSVHGYRVFRVAGDAPTGLPDFGTQAYQVLSLSDARFRPLKIQNHRVAFPEIVSDVVPDLTEVRRNPSAAQPVNLFVTESGLTVLRNRRVVNVNPLVPDGTPVRVVIGSQNAPRVLSHRPGTETPLTVSGGTIDLTFGLAISAIEALTFTEQIQPASALETVLTQYNLLDEAGVQVDMAVRKITGLSSDVAPDGVRVTAIVRLSDGSLGMIQKSPCTFDPLTVQNGQILLDCDIPDGNLLGIFAQAFGNESAAPLADRDLRLTSFSRVKTEPGRTVILSNLKSTGAGWSRGRDQADRCGWYTARCIR